MGGQVAMLLFVEQGVAKVCLTGIRIEYFHVD